MASVLPEEHGSQWVSHAKVKIVNLPPQTCEIKNKTMKQVVGVG